MSNQANEIPVGMFGGESPVDLATVQVVSGTMLRIGMVVLVADDQLRCDEHQLWQLDARQQYEALIVSRFCKILHLCEWSGVWTMACWYEDGTDTLRETSGEETLWYVTNDSFRSAEGQGGMSADEFIIIQSLG